MVWLIRGRVASLSCSGMFDDWYQHLQSLRDAGISHIISLKETPCADTFTNPCNIKVIHFPIPYIDYITVQDAWRFCNELDQLIKENAIVALHCEPGLGRTATMLAIYLLWINQGCLSAEYAISYLRALNFKMALSEIHSGKIQLFAELLMIYRRVGSIF